MMVIEDVSGRLQLWHIGEPLPPIVGRVVQFLASGDELDIILAALDRRYRFKKYEPDE